MDLQRFTDPSTGREVRSIVRDDAPWFVARDVALALGYTNPRDAIAKHVPAHHKGVSRIATPSGEQEMTIIDEPGLYRLIMRSRTPDADRFQEWVTTEVLPSIRRTGSYSATPAAPQVPQTYAEALRAAADAVEGREIAEQRVAALEPAAGAWADLADAEGDYSVRQAAQVLSRVPGLKVGQNTLFARLRDLGWIDKTGQPYQAHVNAGRIVRRTTSYTHPHTEEPVLTAQVRITPKGIAALRDVLSASAQLTIDGRGAA